MRKEQVQKRKKQSAIVQIKVKFMVDKWVFIIELSLTAKAFIADKMAASRVNKLQYRLTGLCHILEFRPNTVRQ